MNILHAVQTRQRNEVFATTGDPLIAGATFPSDIKESSGYAVVNLLLFSDQTFRLRIEEAPLIAGPWTETHRIVSALNTAGTEQQICERIAPCGKYIRFFIDNTSGVNMTSLQALIEGLPIGDRDETNVHIVDGGGIAQTGPFDDGAVNETSVGLYVRAGLTAYDASLPVGARNIPVAARADVAAQAYNLERLLADSILRADNSTTYSALQSRGAVAAQAYTLQRLLVDGVVRGDDGATYSAVAVRDFNSEEVDAATTLIGLLTNSRLAGWRVATNQWRALNSDVGSSISGLAVTTPNGIYANATVVGHDNTGVAVLRPVEARNFDAAADVASTWVGLLTNSRVALYDSAAGNFERLFGVVAGSISGINPAGQEAALACAICTGFDNTGAAVLRPVEARDLNSGADLTQALIGLLVNARLGHLDNQGADYSRTRGDAVSNYSAAGRAASSAEGPWVQAVNAGLDNTGAAVLRPVEARGFGTNAIQGLYSLLVNSMAYCSDLATGNMNRFTGDVETAVSGRAVASVYGPYVHALATGVDNTGAAVLRPVEARGAVAAQAYTLYRLFTDSVTRHDDGASYSPSLVRQAGLTINETLNHLLVRAALTGYDSSAGAGSRSVPVEARNFDSVGDVDSALIGLLTNSRMAAWSAQSSNWVRPFAETPSYAAGLASNAIVGLCANAVTFGFDNTAAAVLRPVEARNFDTAGDVAKALIGLLVNNRNAIYNVLTSDWMTWSGEVAGSIDGRGVASAYSAYTASITVGFDNTGAAVLRPVEARNFDVTGLAGSNSDIVSSLIGLTVNGRIGVYDERVGEWVSVLGTSQVSASFAVRETGGGMLVYQARESGFAAARRGKRFYNCNPTAGTPLTCQTAYVATTPSLVIRINSAAIRLILRSLRLQIANTPGAIVNYLVTMDTTDLYSAGGSAVAARNTNEESATTAVALYYENPTTTGAGARVLDQGLINNVACTEKEIQFDDSLLMGITAATISVYIWAATTAPTVYWHTDAEEVA